LVLRWNRAQLDNWERSIVTREAGLSILQARGGRKEGRRALSRAGVSRLPQCTNVKDIIIVDEDMTRHNDLLAQIERTEENLDKIVAKRRKGFLEPQSRELLL
jgi:hypothetical protein